MIGSGMRTVFVLGVSVRGQREQQMIEEESQAHHDIIQVGYSVPVFVRPLGPAPLLGAEVSAVQHPSSQAYYRISNTPSNLVPL